MDYRLGIRRAVSIKPGLHLRELQRSLGMSFSNTRYHVDRLTKDGEIERVEDGGFSRLYPPRTPSEDRLILSIIQRPADKKILSCLLEKSQLTQKHLSILTGLAKSTISERLTFLQEGGLVEIMNEKISPATYIVAEPARMRTLLQRNSGVLTRATDQFIDLWDF